MPVYRRAVPIITPFVEAVPSGLLLTRWVYNFNFTITDSNKRMCCGKAELSVLIAGAIVNISNTELELWLREATSLPYEHIVKKIEKGWGHVHFRTFDDASKFFYEMKERNFTGPNNCVIKFSASMYFKTRKLINYRITETESSTLPSDTNNPPPSDMNNQIPPPPSETNNQIPPPPSETNNQIPPPPSETNNQIPPPPSDMNNQIPPPPSETNNQIPPPPSDMNNQIPPPPSETNNQIPPPPSETNNQIPPPPSETNNQIPPPPSETNNQIPPPPSDMNNQIPPPPSETNNQIPPPPSDMNNQIPPPPSETNNQIPPPPSETNNQISDKTQYVIYDNNEGFYIVKIYTPGVQRKEQVQIEVSYDDRSITITAESSIIIGFNDCTIIENNIQTRFRVDIIFPRMINTDHPVRVDVEHGITTAMFNIKSNKRKIQII
ncbi:unnamed protein product [Rhizophagus irregularis]|nr:unnamed protein product [Rhizophagus irregularis]